MYHFTIKNRRLVIILLTALFFDFQVLVAQDSLQVWLERHVYTLSHDSLRGREAGTIYAEKAAHYIVNQLNMIGILPYVEGSYSQEFQGRYQNIVGIIQGNDPELKDEYIVVGAHYDHLGFKVENGHTIIYNGADDNASGVAALIEIARNLKERQQLLKRSVILVAFDAEEIGLFGSSHFAANAGVLPEQIRLMLSIDMVGWYKKSGYLEYIGFGTIYKGEELLMSELFLQNELNVRTKPFENSIFTATDTEGFAKKGIPTLAVTTGLKSPYHKPEDDAHLIDYEGLSLITIHISNLIAYVSQDVTFKASGKVAAKHQTTPKRFNWGITGNVGGNHHYYTAGSVNGKSAVAYSIGLVSQFNKGLLAFRTELLYEHIRAKYPEGLIKTNNLTIPLNLVLQTPEMMTLKADVFAGGYYTRRFEGHLGERKIDFAEQMYRNEAGLNFGAGVKIRHIMLAYTHRKALTNLLRQKNANGANIRNRANYFTVTYLF